jgi:hypothetical protein
LTRKRIAELILAFAGKLTNMTTNVLIDRNAPMKIFIFSGKLFSQKDILDKRSYRKIFGNDVQPFCVGVFYWVPGAAAEPGIGCELSIINLLAHSSGSDEWYVDINPHSNGTAR